MQKCSDGDEHFVERFFQLWNEITNTQKIAGLYEVYIQGISKPNEKQKMRAVIIGFLLHDTLSKTSCNFFTCN
jgi:hypothetical protein